MASSSLELVELDIFEIENKLQSAEIKTSHAIDTVRSTECRVVLVDLKSHTSQIVFQSRRVEIA